MAKRKTIDAGFNQGGLEFPPFAQRYLPPEVIQDLLLLKEILDPHEALFTGEFPQEMVIEELKESGIFKDFHLLREMSEKVISHFWRLIEADHKIYGANSQKVMDRINKGFASSIWGLKLEGGETLSPLLNWVRKELAEMIQVLALVEGIRDTQKAKLTDPQLQSWVDEDLFANSQEHAAPGMKDVERKERSVLYCAQWLKGLKVRFSPEDHAGCLLEIKALLQKLRYKEFVRDRGVITCDSGSNDPLRPYMELCVPETLDWFELCRGSVQMAPKTARKRGIDIEKFWFGISAIHGELVPFGHGYTSLRPIFQFYGVEAHYDFLRLQVLRAISEAHANGFLEEREVWKELEERRSQAPSVLVEEIADQLSEVLKEEGVEAPEELEEFDPSEWEEELADTETPEMRPNRTHLRNISVEDIKATLKKFGIKSRKNKKKGGHVTLFRVNPDGSETTFPLPGGKGKGADIEDARFLIIYASHRFGFTREEFLLAFED